jgi:hypothetical protein
LKPAATPDFFRGREGRNNKRIVEILSPSSVRSRRQIRNGLDRVYSVVYDRLTDLEKRGIIEKKGEIEAKKTHMRIPLFGLTSYGLYVAAVHLSNSQARTSASEECRKKLMDHWKTFCKLYGLAEVRTDEPLYDYVTAWLESDGGTSEMLETFGHQILTDEAQALIAFRRMIDMGLLLTEPGEEFEPMSLDEREWKRWPYMMLARIAIKHPQLQKLHSTLREVDAPLYAHLKSHHVREMVALLSKAVPEPVAKKLATTPLFEEYTAGMIDRTRYHITSKSLAETLGDAKKSLRERKQRQLQAKPAQEERKTALEDILAGMIIPIDVVVVEERRLTIVTEDPNQISPEWRQHCDIYHLDETGKVSVTKSETEATVGLAD